MTEHARERIDAADLATLRAITSSVETVWITGNHDPSPPRTSAAGSSRKWRWGR
jgi:metallophosphoesterase superfamily enzyme